MYLLLSLLTNVNIFFVTTILRRLSMNFWKSLKQVKSFLIQILHLKFSRVRQSLSKKKCFNLFLVLYLRSLVLTWKISSTFGLKLIHHRKEKFILILVLFGELSDDMTNTISIRFEAQTSSMRCASHLRNKACQLVRSLGISEYLVLQVKLTTTATEILFEINVKEPLSTGIMGQKKQKKNTKKTTTQHRKLRRWATRTQPKTVATLTQIIKCINW